MLIEANTISVDLFSRDCGALSNRAARTYKKPTGLASDPASLTHGHLPLGILPNSGKNDPIEISTNWGGVERGSRTQAKMSKCLDWSKDIDTPRRNSSCVFHVDW